ncbi:uncharacterized protein LOC124272564 isoform X2 [Haliotis rubra]|uniref:uncharacterized protein LOC124272564 isoform X2 n=1 Tax=Haliotis rubra TaxID=36100 RepID=UPI001EE6125D|nr:uncharacterized protein LOC124272564 isoform X2 [Haliotis rubra]
MIRKLALFVTLVCVTLAAPVPVQAATSFLELLKHVPTGGGSILSDVLPSIRPVQAATSFLELLKHVPTGGGSILSDVLASIRPEDLLKNRPCGFTNCRIPSYNVVPNCGGGGCPDPRSSLQKLFGAIDPIIGPYAHQLTDTGTILG